MLARIVGTIVQTEEENARQDIVEKMFFAAGEGGMIEAVKKQSLLVDIIAVLLKD